MTALSLALPAASAGSKAGRADATLDRALRDLVHFPSGPPGVIAVVQRGDDREIHRAGVANLEFAGRIKPHQRMRLASVSKAFSGAVALRLVERGKLRLDRSIREVLRWLPADWQAVTLRNALQHTSGLPDFTADPAFIAAFGSDLKRSFTHEELIGYVADDPLNFPAGSSYRYSNTDNIIIALMAETAARRSYESLLQRLVFRPLGMRNTLMAFGFTLPQPFVHGYVYDGPGLPLDDVSEAISASSAWASGGIVSTPADLSTFIRGYGGREVLDRETRREQRRFHGGGGSEPPGPGQNSAGLALFLYETRCGSVVGHTGNFPGYTQFAATTRNGRRSATVSVNLQLNETTGPPGAFDALRDVYELAVCAARPGRGH